MKEWTHQLKLSGEDRKEKNFYERIAFLLKPYLSLTHILDVKQTSNQAVLNEIV